MKPASSLPHSQQPATCPCPQPDQSYSGPIYVRSTLISFSHLCLRLPSGMSFGFRHLSNPPFSSTCHAHLIPSENPLQTRYPQQRVAVLSGAEAANSIRKYSARNRIPILQPEIPPPGVCRPPCSGYASAFGHSSEPTGNTYLSRRTLLASVVASSCVTV